MIAKLQCWTLCPNTLHIITVGQTATKLQATSTPDLLYRFDSSANVAKLWHTCLLVIHNLHNIVVVAILSKPEWNKQIKVFWYIRCLTGNALIFWAARLICSVNIWYKTLHCGCAQADCGQTDLFL